MDDWIVVSIGGSILVRDQDDAKYIKELSAMIKELSSGLRLGIVTGGGPLARKYMKLARNFNEAQCYLDRIGIEATRLNARLLVAALADAGVNVNRAVPTTHEQAMSMTDKDVIVMGGTEPGHTTDAVSAILVEHLGALRLVNATSVNGAYTADPATHPDATRIERMTHEELIELVSGGFGAGVNVVIDPLAAAVCARSNIPLYIVDGRDLPTLKNAILGVSAGTIVEG